MAETLVFPVCTVVSGWVHSCVAPFLLAPFCDEHAAKQAHRQQGGCCRFHVLSDILRLFGLYRALSASAQHKDTKSGLRGQIAKPGFLCGALRVSRRRGRTWLC